MHGRFIRQLFMLCMLAAFFGALFTAAGVFLARAAEGVNFFLLDFSTAAKDPSLLLWLKTLQAFQHTGFFIASSLLFALLAGAPPLRYLGMERRPLFFTLLSAALLVAAVQPVVNWIAVWNESIRLPEVLAALERWMREKEDSLKTLTEAFLRSAGPGDLAVNLFVIALLPALGEEMFFRGVLQRLFGEWTRSAHTGVLIAALLFSALHLQFYGFFPRFLLGLLLGYLYVWSRSLWAPVFCHFLNNGAAVCFSYFSQKHAAPFDADTLGTTKGDWPFVILGALLVTVLMYGIYRMERRRRPET